MEEGVPPAPGLMDLGEEEYFDQLEPEDDPIIWPWLLGGALLGL
jgi:hypothetical protein